MSRAATALAAGGFAVAVALAPACFRPSYDRPACGPGGACPGGMSCVGGFCERPDPGGGDAALLDAAADAMAPTVRVCLGTFVNVCVDVPDATRDLTAGIVDTSNASATTPCLPYTSVPAVDACVIAARSISISSGSTVSATGAKRLILFARETVTIAGTLDVASHRGGRSGPAADSGPCPTNASNPTVAGQGGGGWGGTFGGPGNGGGSTPGGGQGGIPGATLNITSLGGGCPGGSGAGSNGGGGGHGGGAVLLLAGQSISISGTLNASGAGGSGGKAALVGGSGGGGGGGAGGMIVLDAPLIQIPGQCFANGGGGGEGGSQLAGGGGGESTAPTVVGSGGQGLSVGGDGGNGGVGTTGSRPGANGSSVVNPPDTGGGGGGGGGVGLIKIISAAQATPAI